MSATRSSLLAFLLGILAVAGFAPLYLHLVTLLALAGLLGLWAWASPRESARLGFAFGLGYFGTGVSWIYVSLHQFGAMPAFLAVGFTVLLAAVLALFPAAVGWVQAKAPLGTLRRTLAGAAAWTLAEWVRGWIFTGFPWLAAGYSQIPSSPLAGFAPLLGWLGVTGATLLAAAFLRAAFARRGRARWTMAGGLLLLLLAGGLLKNVEWTRPVGPPVSVSLLQGNIPQDVKWREDRLRLSLDTYAGLAATARGRLVILPETALPLFLDQVPPAYLELLAQGVKARGGDLVVGLPEYAPDGRRYFNSAFSLGTSPPQAYRKVHLVPFGEYIPLRPLLGWFVDLVSIPLTDFQAGAADQPPLAVAGQKVAVNICYEDVFGEEIIRPLPEATLLANLSNDAWFGDSLAPWQHMQMSQMRALETGRTVLRATNTGATAIIGPRGDVQAKLPHFTLAVLEGEAQGYAGATPYVRLGNLPVVGLALLGLFLAFRRRDT